MVEEKKTYTEWCSTLKKMVTLDWYAKYCECGKEILGVPKKDE